MKQIGNITTSERVHVGFYGRCNSGKSSLINTIAGQEVSIVSEQAGTTTDSVAKNIELPGVGAAVLIDTAGFDDDTLLGQQRVESTRRSMMKTDVAVLLFSGADIEIEQSWLKDFQQKNIPVIGVVAKSDLLSDKGLTTKEISVKLNIPLIQVSAKTGEGIAELLKQIALFYKSEHRLLTDGLCQRGDTVILVMPQDNQAPKGRLIKPQVEMLRELLDKKCIAICCDEGNYESILASLKNLPQMVITDSQVFKSVYEKTPNGVNITSFSILFARQKGDIDLFIRGAKVIASLTENSRVLIAEACSHIPQNEDIGRVKLPRMLRKYIGENLSIDVVGGNDFPRDLTQYDLVIHCGACMFNRRHVMSRVAQAVEQNVPITNYGISIAFLNGILDNVVY